MGTDDYTAPRALIAEGARIGLMTCKQCGATIVLDPDDFPAADVLHDRWHAALADTPEASDA